MKKLVIIGVSSLLVRKITYCGSVHNWIRDKFYILKKKRSASTLDEMAGIIYSIMREKPPLYFEKTPYKKSTILKILKNKSWGAE